MKNARLYSLFTVEVVDGKKVFTRDSTAAYPKAQAVRVFQDALLAHFFGSGPVRELRPIKRSFSVTSILSGNVMEVTESKGRKLFGKELFNLMIRNGEHNGCRIVELR